MVNSCLFSCLDLIYYILFVLLFMFMFLFVSLDFYVFVMFSWQIVLAWIVISLLMANSSCIWPNHT